MSEERDDIKMAFIRCLSTGGLILSGEISLEAQCERIRMAIIERRLKDVPFPFNEELTYGQAFERCFQRGVERRRLQRDIDGRPLLHTRQELIGPGEPGDDDEGDDEDEDEVQTRRPAGETFGHSVNSVPQMHLYRMTGESDL